MLKKYNFNIRTECLFCKQVKKIIGISLLAMFHRLSGLLLFLFFLSFSVAAQSGVGTSKEISLRISAEVSSRVEVMTIQNIQFDQTRPSQNYIEISPVNHTNAGYMKASGKPNAQVRISYIQKNTVYKANGTGALTFNYLIAVNDNIEQATSELILDNDNNFTLNNDGELFIWIGGRVDLSNAGPGRYVGNFMLEIEYI